MSEPGQQQPLPETVKQAIHDGRKVDAIKQLRAEWKIGLKEAKEEVDHYVFNNPSLFPQAMPSAGVGAGKIIIVIMIIAAVGFLFNTLVK